MQKRDPLRWRSPGSQRLRWVRLAEGFDNSAQFASHVGLGTTAYSQYENGVRLSLDAAIKIANRVPGLTTDFLVRGREEGMPAELRRRIEAVREREEAELAPEEPPIERPSVTRYGPPKRPSP
jgi:transcriptional regulator with XRE-family HTH domain